MSDLQKAAGGAGADRVSVQCVSWNVEVIKDVTLIFYFSVPVGQAGEAESGPAGAAGDCFCHKTYFLIGDWKDIDGRSRKVSGEQVEKIVVILTNNSPNIIRSKMGRSFFQVPHFQKIQICKNGGELKLELIQNLKNLKNFFF